jgi:hypothetical protein
VRQVFETTCGEGDFYIALSRPSSSKGAFLQPGLLGIGAKKQEKDNRTGDRENIVTFASE